jgi:hypothetical protein
MAAYGENLMATDKAELAGVLAREKAQARQARPTKVAPRRLGFLSSR